MQRKKSLNDILICIGVLIFLCGFIVQLGGVSKESRGYPLFLIICSVLLTAALLVKSIRSYKQEEAMEKTPDFAKTLLLIVVYSLMIAAYVFLMDKIGYIISTLLFVVASLLFLKVRNIPLLVLLPVGLTASMYFLFTKFLLVTLPGASWLGF